MKIVKNIINTIITILIIVVLIVSILIAVMALTSKASGISTIFGYTVQTIQSDSMKGGYKGEEGYTGGDFEKGDVIIGKSTGFDSSAVYNLGDIITYIGLLKGAEDAGEQLICHRIVAVDDSNGYMTYQTKGDNEQTSPVADQDDSSFYIDSSQIGSVFHNKEYDGIVLHGVGNFLDFLRTQFGFFLVVLLPMIVFFLYELIRVVFNYAGYKKAKEFEAKEGGSGDTIAVPVPVSVESTTPKMSEDEYKEFQEFQAFKKMQEQMKKQEEVKDENDSDPNDGSQSDEQQ